MFLEKCRGITVRALVETELARSGILAVDVTVDSVWDGGRVPCKDLGKNGRFGFVVHGFVNLHFCLELFLHWGSLSATTKSAMPLLRSGLRDHNCRRPISGPFENVSDTTAKPCLPASAQRKVDPARGCAGRWLATGIVYSAKHSEGPVSSLRCLGAGIVSSAR